jgi:two-component system chemotaxis response regulator CheY
VDTPKRILYADDHVDSCDMMRALLSARGYEAETAHTLADALTLARSAEFDLFVIDNHFPDGTGAELCTGIRGFNAMTPIIIYSGTSTEADVEEGLRPGAQTYVRKPFIEELLAEVARFLAA